MVLEQQHDAALSRALTRAQARGIAVRLLSEVIDGDDVSKWFETSSHSTPGSRHHVAVLYSGNGIDVSCDCDGAQHGQVCQHVAAVSHVEGLVAGTYSVPDLAEAPAPANPHQAWAKEALAHWDDDEAAIWA